MATSPPVFLDANVLLYSLDETSEPYLVTTNKIQELLSHGTTLCTSHHVVEEVLHIIQKLPESQVLPSQVVAEIADIPNLVLVEPAADISFAQRYASLCERLNLGVNDALLLQLMIDAGIAHLFTYDKKFANKAASAGMQILPG